MRSNGCAQVNDNRISSYPVLLQIITQNSLMNLFFLWKNNFLLRVLVVSGIHRLGLLEFYDDLGFNSVHPALPFLKFSPCFISSLGKRWQCSGEGEQLLLHLSSVLLTFFSVSESTDR